MMKLYDILLEEKRSDFWKQVDIDYMGDVKSLSNLISDANEYVFKKFKINPRDKVYFIAGSARLYASEKLRNLFNINTKIGDLDIVIPDRRLWERAGLGDKSTYVPTEDIEVFDTWDPSKAGGTYADINVDSDENILDRSTMIGDYYFMSTKDIIEYKSKMRRDKEIDIVKIVDEHQIKTKKQRYQVMKKIADEIGIEETKEFFGKLRHN